MGKLTDAALRSAKPKDKPYKLADGGGLFLLVKPNGARLWRYKYRIAGKEGLFSIGSYPETGLAAAREAHASARKIVKRGVHPTHHRRNEKLRQTFEHANTFETVAWEWFTKRTPRWGKQRENQIKRLLEKELLPGIGAMPIRQVHAQHILEAIQKVEARGYAYLAALIRQTASQVFQYAVATLRADADPAAALKGAIQMPPAKHHRTFGPKDIPHFLEKLDGFGGEPTTATALRLLLLTFVRKTELRAAEWSEFDLDGAEWRIPAARMKMDEEHIVPLPRQAVELLKALHALTGHRTHLFPNRKRPTAPMAASTLNVALSSMGVTVPPHGFRGTASTILNEMGFHADVIERQLAHAPRNKVRAAYNHALYLDERRGMLQAWADYLDSMKEKQNVVPINRQTA